MIIMFILHQDGITKRDEASQKADMEKVHKKQYKKRKRMTF